MDILFPRVVVNYDFSDAYGLSSPKDCIGNPKAIAAQTFKSKRAGMLMFEAKTWMELSHLFKTQYSTDLDRAPTIPVPETDEWIIYPYALGAINEDRACLVWREKANPRWIRHVRVYRNDACALADNQFIAQSINALLNFRFN